MDTPLEKYINAHCSTPNEALDWLESQTHIRTNYSRMLSGKAQGTFLSIITSLMRAERVLEIGTFTGYSAICIAGGLSEGGHIDTLEINDELESLIREGWERAGVSDKITMHIGDARETLVKMKDEMSRDGKKYDLVFLDANKREYCEYFGLVIDMLRPGGCIIADDVLWDGKVYADPVPKDKQTQGIVRFNEMIAADGRLEKLILPIRDGIFLIRKR